MRAGENFRQAVNRELPVFDFSVRNQLDMEYTAITADTAGEYGVAPADVKDLKGKLTRS